jgi:hypothetical protein
MKTNKRLSEMPAGFEQCAGVIIVRMAIGFSDPQPDGDSVIGFASTHTMHQLLYRTIESAGAQVLQSFMGKPINRALFMFGLRPRIFRSVRAGQALDAVSKELSRIGLLQWARIAWCDRSLQPRMHYPSGGAMPFPSLDECWADIAEIKRHTDQLIELTARMQKREQDFNRSEDDGN